MRFILRLLLTWIILLPLIAYFGFPYLQSYLQEKTQRETHAQCLAQAATMPATFDPAQPAIAQQYCDCVQQGVTLSRTDLMGLLRRQPPTAMQERLAAHVDTCTQKLHSPAQGDAQIIHF